MIPTLSTLLVCVLCCGCASEPYVAPVCLKSHMEVVPKHVVGYVAGQMGFTRSYVVIYETPEATVERCDEWKMP